MIIKNDQGQVIVREEEVVTREQIVTRQAQVKQELSNTQARLNTLLKLEKQVDEDLAEFDRLSGEPAPAATDPQPAAADPQPAPLNDQNTNAAQDTQTPPEAPPAPTA